MARRNRLPKQLQHESYDAAIVGAGPNGAGERTESLEVEHDVLRDAARRVR